jgi:hypothetical protein
MTSRQIEINRDVEATCACGCGESLPEQFLSKYENGRLYWPGHEPRRPQLDETLDELAHLTAKWSRLKTAARELIAARSSTAATHDPTQEGFQNEGRRPYWIVRSEEMNALEAAIEDEK